MTQTDATQGWMHVDGGVRLAGRRWPCKDPLAAVVIIHGYADHSLRYTHVGRFLREQRVASFAVDLRGHGQSEGRRGHINSFDDYLDDVDAMLAVVEQNKLNVPTFLLGHSMGGLVALTHALRRGQKCSGLILSSPFLGVALEVPPIKQFLGRIMSNVWPSLALPSGINPRDLTHDTVVCDDYATDPLVFKTATARWYTEALRTIGDIQKRAFEITLPTLILQAAEDRLADPKAARPLFEKLGSKDKRYIEYPNFFHEIFNEVDKDKPLRDVQQWIMEHLQNNPKS